MTRKLIGSIALLAVTTLPAAAQKTKVRQATTSNSADVYEVETSSARSYLGVDISDINKDRASALNLKDDRGVEVTQVDQDAPAGKAGFKEHDVILNFNGTPVESEEQFRRLIRETRPGRTVAVDITRNGQTQTLKVQLADRKRFMAPVVAGAPHAFAFPVPPSIAVPPMALVPPDVPHDWTDQMVTHVYRSPSGATVENLSPQLGDYFGIKNAEGMLVRSVQKGSPADVAGLRAGDVIVRVDEQRITDHSDWAEAMRNPKHGKVSVTIMRERRQLTLPMSLPSGPRDSSALDKHFGPDVEDAADNITDALEDMQPAIEESVVAATKAAAPAIRASQKEVAKAIEKASTEVTNTLVVHRGDIEREIHLAMAQASAELKAHGSDVDKAMRDLQKAMEDFRVDKDNMQ
jgi:membrane-associated protease RseP (regulator of RpoE activity)